MVTMPRHAPPTLRDDLQNRRHFLKVTGVGTATALVGVVPARHLVEAGALTKEQRDELTPDVIIALMKKGNEHFRLRQESPHNYLAQQKASA